MQLSHMIFFKSLLAGLFLGLQSTIIYNAFILKGLQFVTNIRKQLYLRKDVKTVKQFSISGHQTRSFPSIRQSAT